MNAGERGAQGLPYQFPGKRASPAEPPTEGPEGRVRSFPPAERSVCVSGLDSHTAHLGRADSKGKRLRSWKPPRATPGSQEDCLVGRWFHHRSPWRTQGELSPARNGVSPSGSLKKARDGKRRRKSRAGTRSPWIGWVGLAQGWLGSWG